MSAVVSFASLDGRFADARAIGRSAAWRDVVDKATRVASTTATVLLQGESGTGKEVLARLIHRMSPRKDGLFVPINCAAIPEPLFESELFGHERGAFTGAHQSKPGQIELASTGVLFLDEVSEMPPSAQVKLLRFLEGREIQRLGGTRTLKANARVIAATNRDLRRAVEERRFREDLYYRLQVFDIRVPPLRERMGDLLLLADAFLQEFSRTMGRPFGLTREAEQMLLAHSWPGNVRELRNALERAAILSDDLLIGTEHLSLVSVSTVPLSSTDLRLVERRTIEQVLRETEWNKSKAANRLGLTRSQLYARLRKYGLEAPSSA
jgi:transcriptional regulator with GAF, ATPase, and Fis domain